MKELCFLATLCAYKRCTGLEGGEEPESTDWVMGLKGPWVWGCLGLLTKEGYKHMNRTGEKVLLNKSGAAPVSQTPPFLPLSVFSLEVLYWKI